MNKDTHVLEFAQGSSDEGLPLINEAPSDDRAPKSTTSRPSAAMMGVVCFAALSGFLFGYDTSAISGVLLVMDPPLTVPQNEVFVSIALLAAAIGSPIGGSLSDRFGRRVAIGISSLLFCIGSLVLALGPDSDATGGFAVLLVGRAIVGSAIGVSSAIVPMFVAELSPPKWRGSLMGVQIAAITFGQFISYLVDVALLPAANNWRWMLGVPLVPALIQLVGVFLFVPESPLWLASHGLVADAHKVIRRIAHADFDAALADLNHSLEIRQIEPRTMRETARGLWLIRSQLLLGCALQAFQQLVGINTIMYYSSVILSQSGFGDKSHPRDAMLMSAAVAGGNALFTLVAIYLVDRVGRRKLMLYTLPGVIVALGLMSFTFFAINAAPTSAIALPTSVTSGMALGGMLLYICTFASGMGLLPWAVTGEIFPSALAGRANAVTTATNWLTNLAVSITFLTLFTAYSGAAFAGYAVIAVVAFVYFYFKLPETAGLSLSEIQLLFQDRNNSGGKTERRKEAIQ